MGIKYKTIALSNRHYAATTPRTQLHDISKTTIALKSISNYIYKQKVHKTSKYNLLLPQYQNALQLNPQIFSMTIYLYTKYS